MTELISISLTPEAAKLVARLKAKRINISEAFCEALVDYHKRKQKPEASK